jgi:hypothetical protein
MNDTHLRSSPFSLGIDERAHFCAAAHRAAPLETHDGPRRQVELFEQAEAQGRPHRERLRATRRVEEDGAEARLGDGQQTGRRCCQEEEQYAEKSCVEEERRKEDRASEIVDEEDFAQDAAQKDIAQKDDSQDAAIAPLSPSTPP